MHCGTEFSLKTEKHNSNSKNGKKFVNLYEKIFPQQNYQLLKEKFFLSNSNGLLIALGDKQFKMLRKIYGTEFPNVLWVDFESPKLNKRTKIVTWIPHPSPGNPFFNRTDKCKGTMDSLNFMNEQLTLENSEEIINKACVDYKDRTKRQATQMVFLRFFFNNL